MRRFLLILLLLPVLIGFPTPQVSADDSSETPAPPSADEIMYWTGGMASTDSDCAFNPNKDRLCVDEVYIDGRKLEYKTADSLRNQSSGYIQVHGYSNYFYCWSPTWRPSNVSKYNDPEDPRHRAELCSYSQFTVYFPSGGSKPSATFQPKLTIKVRKMMGTFPGTHLGFLHSSGPVHDFVPTSQTNEHAMLTISPGLVIDGGGFNLSLQDTQQPEIAQSPSRWQYGFFLASGKVTGTYDLLWGTGFEILPESFGAWQATNASSWGFFGDYRTPDYAIRVAGPHFKHKVNPSDPDELNTAWFTAYMPRALVQRQFGLTPEQSNESNIEVTRSVGRNPTQLPSTFTATTDGLLIQTNGITFSSPVISIKRKINIGRNKRMTPASIINAAGIPKNQRASARIIVNPCRSSRKGCFFANSRFVFTKKGTYRFTISYKSRDGRKKSIVNRSRVTVRVR